MAFIETYISFCNHLHCSLWTRQLERSGSWQGQLQTPDEDAFIYTVLKHYCIRDVSLYKLTYLHTYFSSAIDANARSLLNYC